MPLELNDTIYYLSRLSILPAAAAAIVAAAPAEDG